MNEVLLENKTILSETIEKMCDNYCKFPFVCADEETLESVCEGCPMNKLMDCEVQKSHEIQTNYDRIKTMNVEELADVFYFGIDNICFENCTKNTGNKFKCSIEDDVTPENCKDCIKRWLEAEVNQK